MIIESKPLHKKKKRLAKRNSVKSKDGSQEGDKVNSSFTRLGHAAAQQFVAQLSWSKLPVILEVIVYFTCLFASHLLLPFLQHVSLFSVLFYGLDKICL